MDKKCNAGKVTPPDLIQCQTVFVYMIKNISENWRWKFVTAAVD